MVAYLDHTSWGYTDFSITRGDSGESWTPSATPDALLVGIAAGPTAVTQHNSLAVNSISLGTPIGENILTTGESHTTLWYLMPDSVPSGALTFALTTNNAVRSHITMIALSASDTVEVVDSDFSASLRTQTYSGATVTLSPGGRSCFGALVFASGHSDPANVSPNTGWGGTIADETDFGVACGGCYGLDSVTSSDVTNVGWTQSSDDGVGAAILVSEVVGSSFQTAWARNSNQVIQ